MSLMSQLGGSGIRPLSSLINLCLPSSDEFCKPQPDTVEKWMTRDPERCGGREVICSLTIMYGHRAIICVEGEAGIMQMDTARSIKSAN